MNHHAAREKRKVRSIEPARIILKNNASTTKPIYYREFHTYCTRIATRERERAKRKVFIQRFCRQRILILERAIDMAVTWRMRRKIPQRGFLIRRDTCDRAQFPLAQGVASAGRPIFTAARYIRRSRSTEGLAAKITSNWMGVRGGGVSLQPPWVFNQLIHFNPESSPVSIEQPFFLSLALSLSLPLPLPLLPPQTRQDVLRSKETPLGVKISLSLLSLRSPACLGCQTFPVTWL